MAIQKNFVVKNGLEVNDNLIFADTTINSVGIATTIANYTLHVNGGIGATDLYVSGIATASAFYGDGSNLTFSGPLSLSGLVVSGVSTLGVTTATDLTLQNLYVSGIGTIINSSITNLTGTAGTITTLVSTNGFITNLIGTAGTITDLSVTNGSVTNLTGTAGTITDLSVTNGSITNLTGTAATIGAVQISSGIVTASSGIVTYYGDGQYLQNILSGVGVATESGLVGTGATILDFRGAGISTVTVASGIATINITGGGGGGGAIGIGSTFPGTPASLDPAPSSGDLFFHIDYGRTFLYYDEVALGIGATAVWIDSAPFNQGGLYVNKYGDNMYAGLGVTIGTLTNPSIYFNGYTNSGFYSPAANEFGVVVSGTEKLNVNAGGINIIGVATATSTVIGSATTFTEDLVVQGDARVTGILTVGTSSITLDGSNNQINVGTGLTLSSIGIVAGIITATSFVGDGSGLTGAGSTVADDTTTNVTFYPVFTQTTSGIITASKVSTSKLSFNPSSGTLTATTFSGALNGNATSATSATNATNATNVAITNNTSTNSTYYVHFGSATSGNDGVEVDSSTLTYNPATNTLTSGTFSGALSGNATSATTLQTSRTINGVSFNGSANIVVNPTTGAYSNGQGAKTIQSGGSASGGSSGDIYYIY